MVIKHRHSLLGRTEVVDETRLQWPGGARLALCLMFECWTSGGTGLQIIGTTVDYGMRRGIWNVLELLARYQAPATFFVDAPTAGAYPEAVRAMATGGHELAVLGEAGRPQWQLGIDEERRYIADARAGVAEVLGELPRGWRSSQCRPSRNTLGLLAEAGVTWDSSLRNDDYPYRIHTEHGALNEIPGGGAADYRYYSTFPGPMMLPPVVETVWLDELAVAREEAAKACTMAVFTFNPSYTGRPGELGVLDTVLRAATDGGDIWLATAGQVSDVLDAGDALVDEEARA